MSFGRGAEMAQRAAGRPIGFVFQQFNLIPSLSVLDNVALPLLYQGLAPMARRMSALLGKPGKFTAKMLISNWRWWGWWSPPV